MKEYRSRWNSYVLSLRIGKRAQRISFEGFVRQKESYLRTDDKQLQQALETHPLFGTDFYLYKDETPAAKAEAKKAEVSKSQDAGDKPIIEESITEIMQAREYLIKNLGIDYRKLNTPASILKQAAENNIEFPNLNI